MIDASSLTDKLLLLGNSDGASDTLIGGQSKDNIVAGKGDSSLWGGAGNDLIESNGEVSNTIFFLSGDGSDTVKGFTAYDDSRSDNYDKLKFGDQGITSVKNTSQGIQLSRSNDKLTLAGDYTANSMILWEGGGTWGVSKIGKTGEKNNFTYRGEVTQYLGSTDVDTLSFGEGDGNVSIWLSGSQGVYYDSIEIIDGRKITGTGKNVYYYGKNEGNDIINNSKADDEVMLHNMSAGDLKDAVIGTNQITITQQNGNKLTVNGQAHEFTLADGSTWSADLKSETWSQVK